jgi:hypothetical protein
MARENKAAARAYPGRLLFLFARRLKAAGRQPPAGDS